MQSKASKRRQDRRARRRARVRGRARQAILDVNRRQFLGFSAGAGALIAGAPFIKGCGGDDDDAGGGNNPLTEQRTYVFNLSFFDTSNHDVVLVAGRDRVLLEQTTPDDLINLRDQHPILERVPDEHLTHFVTRAWPADSIQLCYLQRVVRGSTDGSWDLPLFFYHTPVSSLMDARVRMRDISGSDPLPVPGKWQRYGLTADDLDMFDDPEGQNDLKDSSDSATALVAGHPELASGEPNSAAHVQCNIIANQSSTTILAQSIESQGPATPDGGWATQVELINPDTNEVARNSQGQIQYVPEWSQQTNQFAGMSVDSSVTQVKDDTTLGANITDVDSTELQDNDTTAPTNGALWTLHDGMPTVDADAPDDFLGADAFMFTYTPQNPSNGYSFKVTGVDENRNVSIEVENWYVRHLSLYVRYLDANDQPIAISDLPDSFKSSSAFQNAFPLQECCSDQNGEFDLFTSLLTPEFTILGIPVSTTKADKTFPMPEGAASALVLASGIGSGSNSYPATIVPGAVMTGVFNLSIPPLFLALNAAAGLSGLNKELQDTTQLLSLLPLVIQLLSDEFAAVEYGDAAAFEKLGVQVGKKILTSAAKPLMQFVASALAEGETEQDLLDAIPVIGGFMAAVACIGVITQLAETSVQIANSPTTYVGKVVFTHDVEVTISPDPLDPAGFPATATYYKVTAQFDQGSPWVIERDLPGTTVTDPIMVTFEGVPFGGRVSISVGFYSDTDWLAGQGSVGPVDNVSSNGPLMLAITITENLVPMESDTVYSHKEIIELDAQGNHQWVASDSPPEVTTVQGECESADGQLCSLTGITVSTVSAAVGYAWESYNSQVSGCATGGPSQLYQFANLSVTSDPQSGYLYAGCGFRGATRIVYDLLGKSDFNFYLDPTDQKNLIRQIRLTGDNPEFDGPDSNKAWGQLQFESDAMLLHPAGRIISIHSASNKIEVIELPAAAVADDEAPLSQAYSGKGIREGLMNGPTLAALAPDGSILILETANNRIQAFDLGANPVPLFREGAYTVPLVDQATGYLDLSVENAGYMYVLSYTGQTGSLEFRLDIYTPDGDHLARTTGFAAAKLAVNYWRDIFALNYQVLRLPNGSLPASTEPSVSHWIPSTPSANL